MSDQSLLDGVDNRARLKVEKSTLALGFLGLTATMAMSELDDVFFKPQLLHLADNNHLDSTCDGCFMWLGDSVNLRTCTINVEGVWPTLKKCTGCGVVRYCSKVSDCRTLLPWRKLAGCLHSDQKNQPNSNYANLSTVLSTKGLEKPPQG